MVVENNRIYPNILEWSTKDIGISLHLLTYLRKEENGIWYLMLIQKSFNIRLDVDMTARMLGCYKEFTAEVYNCMLLGRIDFDLRGIAGRSIFERDDNQQSEVERLTKLLSL